MVDFNGKVRCIRADYRFGKYFTPGTNVVFGKNVTEVIKRVDDNTLLISIDGVEQCVKDSELEVIEKEDALASRLSKSQIKVKQNPTKDDCSVSQESTPSDVLQEENQKLKKEIEELRKTIENQSAQIKSLSQSKDENGVLNSAYEREIDLLRGLMAEYEKQLEDDKRAIHDFVIKQGELTHSIGEKDAQIRQLQYDIQQLKADLERVNNISLMQRLFGKK